MGVREGVALAVGEREVARGGVEGGAGRGIPAAARIIMGASQRPPIRKMKHQQERLPSRRRRRRRRMWPLHHKKN